MQRRRSPCFCGDQLANVQFDLAREHQFLCAVQLLFGMGQGVCRCRVKPGSSYLFKRVLFCNLCLERDHCVVSFFH